MNCPNCSAAMVTETLDGHLGTSVAIDLCLPCQLFWFDTRENLKLAPGAVLKLFQIIAGSAQTKRAATRDRPRCPHCGARLRLTQDQQRNTRFQYMRCVLGHGRLTTFVDFLREKDFIRPLSPQQIAQLRQGVQIVNCSNCGAPIDLARNSACRQCGSPISMLDVKRAGTLLDELRDADQAARQIDPALPLRLEQARAEVESVFASLDRWWKQQGS
jgi:Zn-finger nucleic acid-binding protein